jgi:hypothetical protein
MPYQMSELPVRLETFSATRRLTRNGRDEVLLVPTAGPCRSTQREPIETRWVFESDSKSKLYGAMLTGVLTNAVRIGEATRSNSVIGARRRICSIVRGVAVDGDAGGHSTERPGQRNTDIDRAHHLVVSSVDYGNGIEAKSRSQSLG